MSCEKHKVEYSMFAIPDTAVILTPRGKIMLESCVDTCGITEGSCLQECTKLSPGQVSSEQLNRHSLSLPFLSMTQPRVVCLVTSCCHAQRNQDIILSIAACTVASSSQGKQTEGPCCAG